MPELPEVEAFGRWLLPQIRGRRLEAVTVLKPRLVRPCSALEFSRALEGSRIRGIQRRGKSLLWDLVSPGGDESLLVSHLGMTGSWQVLSREAPLPRHAAVVFAVGDLRVVLDDPRQFGHLRLGAAAVPVLGPEPLDEAFTPERFGRVLAECHRPVKVALMDPSRLAGVGNLYASEALFLAGIDPTTPADRLEPVAVARLHGALQAILSAAVERNLRALRSHRPMLYQQDGLPDSPAEGGLWVYDREGLPCRRCGSPIHRFVQSGRSTYQCPRCQQR
jgi:formamidopyrimidine-DNA glycosylase